MRASERRLLVAATAFALTLGGLGLYLLVTERSVVK